MNFTHIHLENVKIKINNRETNHFIEIDEKYNLNKFEINEILVINFIELNGIKKTFFIKLKEKPTSYKLVGLIYDYDLNINKNKNVKNLIIAQINTLNIEIKEKQSKNKINNIVITNNSKLFTAFENNINKIPSDNIFNNYEILYHYITKHFLLKYNDSSTYSFTNGVINFNCDYEITSDLLPDLNSDLTYENSLNSLVDENTPLYLFYSKLINSYYSEYKLYNENNTFIN